MPWLVEHALYVGPFGRTFAELSTAFLLFSLHPSHSSPTLSQELLSVAAQLHRLNVELRPPSQVSQSDP